MLEQQLTPATLADANHPADRQTLDQIIALTERITKAEGRIKTSIPFLTIVRNTRQTPPIPAVLTPSLCLILQGGKRIHFGQDIIDCQPGNFLASVIHMPASAQVVGATKKSPYIGLRLDLMTKEIASVMTEAEISIKPENKKLNIGAFIGKADTDLLDLFIRLLKVVEKPGDTRFLSELIKREIIFNLLSGDYGHLFFQQVFFDRQSDGVGKAIAWIEENFTRSFTVEELAKATSMSVSGLHHKFKAVTTMGPLQYQKQLRLQEARRLMLSGAVDATTAALEVGYESPSQFSREYRRLFGLPPFKDIKALRKLAGATAIAASFENS
ncbi:MAG TPA: AraC family transcriptional regulator [Phototrophicaceae bacterium]|jgi:AraC-like DNA-binding protein|nr:AraC family transcriptional regulator [Phototrophicaceae bacterium]